MDALRLVHLADTLPDPQHCPPPSTSLVHNQTGNQSINQYINQSINQLINQPISTDQALFARRRWPTFAIAMPFGDLPLFGVSADSDPETYARYDAMTARELFRQYGVSKRLYEVTHTAHPGCSSAVFARIVSTGHGQASQVLVLG